MANNTAWLRSLEERVVREAAAGGAEGAAMATSALARSKLRGRTDLGPMRATLDSVTATLLDLFSLVDARYLLGVSAPSGGRAVASRHGWPSWARLPPTAPRRRRRAAQAYYSTLSLNACYFRGVARMYGTWGAGVPHARPWVARAHPRAAPVLPRPRAQTQTCAGCSCTQRARTPSRPRRATRPTSARIRRGTRRGPRP